jgi:hypothetical protein
MRLVYNFDMLKRVSPIIRFVPLFILLVSIAARLVPGLRTIDDAFITYRYARNILAGNGFVYNPGEHVLGTTTPFYTILLVIFGSLSGGVSAPFPQISLIINTLADAITCLLLLDLGRRFGSPRAGWGAALVWAVAPFSVTFAIGGLETSLYVFLLTATTSAYLRKRFTLAALMGAFALLTRPDALILLGPLVLDRLLQLSKSYLSRTSLERFIKFDYSNTLGFISNPSASQPTHQIVKNEPVSRRNKHSLWIEIAVFAIPTLIWIIFATYYFGSPLPHSIAAKSLAYRLPPDAALVRLLQHFATPFLEHLTFGIPAIAVGLVLYPFLYIIGARRALSLDFHSWPFLAYPWLYFATFALANPLIFRWYLTPPLPVYILFILTGADTLLMNLLGKVSTTSNQAGYLDQKSSTSGDERILPNQEADPVKRNSIFQKISQALPLILVIILPVFLTSRDWSLHPDHGPNRPAPQMAWIQLELLYRQAAEALAPKMVGKSPQPVLAAGDVGVLGFYTPAKILDTVGLNSPQSTQYYPLDSSFYSINYAVPPDLILDELPDYVVILEVYGRSGLLKDPRFLAAYHLLQKIPTDIYGSDGMLIFQHN